MKLQQIRNATMKITYGGRTFLLDPWLQDMGTGFSAQALRQEMNGVKCPLNPLPIPPEAILQGVQDCLVTHVHPDHFTPDYLPRDIRIWVQNRADQETLSQWGFENVGSLEEGSVTLGPVVITRTPAVHGDNPQVVARMGPVSGYLLSGEEKKLYLAADTVFNQAVAQTLTRYTPEVIVLNCCQATTPLGQLIMGLEDVEAVCRLCPQATVIATHLDSVNHALVSREDVRRFAREKGLTRLLVPEDGEGLTF